MTANLSITSAASKNRNSAVPGPTFPAAHPGWRAALPALILTLLAIFVLYRETALGMASIWARSDTYAHGFVVPPITIWLIWRMRERIALLAPRHNYPALVLLAVAGFAWLLGEMATANVVPQFALIFTLVFAVVAVLGRSVARSMAFPLLFLFFAVPFGDFTQPKLMEWTAKFTVLGLRLSGIPVFSEGQNLVIPSGNWSVVEACSGVRYLIASLTVGTLFAYLTYHSLRRRLIFVGISILVPILANWGRAYMIVMLGHLSGNRLAVGVDHLIYGWLFFGVVIMAMFWIGARWREDAPPAVQTELLQQPGDSRPDSAVWLAAVAAVLVASIWPLAQWRVDHDVAPPVKQLAPLAPIPGWQSEPAGSIDWRPRFENYAASTQVTFEKDRQSAGLFLAYYRNQDQQHKMVSSTNVLVTNSDPVWAPVTHGTREIAFLQEAFTVRTAELRAITGERLLVWQWYWVNGRWTANDIIVKAYTVWSRLLGDGDDSAVVIIYTLLNRPGEAEALLENVSRAAVPAIEAVLRQTRDAR
ncbi:MAG TPA: exosortase A [Accumulibacter sp.]|uniref:exosortase A n=1 Tax=Accumulibacter sp. TaxID=2053492 RepID=UPI0025ED0F4C|nr:exosortase A [Accumulibacter sp.]MCM8600497.1 exosortase A [Accumulibacter sp.]MCM8662525.1 exosortase A [Accumulibacter sp.]HNC51661.1 exosortase A [Accumulibacter sp.]